MVGEEGSVREVLLGVVGRLEDAPELVKLVEPVLARPGEAAKNAAFDRSHRFPLDGDHAGDDANAGSAAGRMPLPRFLIDEHELEDRKVAGQDDQVVGASLAEIAGEFSAGFGRQRPKLHEDDAEELLFVLSQQFHAADRVGGLGGQAESGRRQLLA